MEGIILVTCSVCGHRERDSASNALMTKIRMWNHVRRAHPAQVEEYREVALVERDGAVV